MAEEKNLSKLSCTPRSECPIASVETGNSVLTHFFAIRLGEIVEHREAWRKKDCIVDNIFHIPGPENPSDFYIRGEGERALAYQPLLHEGCAGIHCQGKGFETRLAG